VKKDKVKAYCWKWLRPPKGCLVISTINLEPSTTKQGVREWLGPDGMDEALEKGSGKIVKILISEV